MWELNYKQSWALKNWCFGTVVLEKTIESPLDCREIKPVHPKGNQSWIFIGRTDAEAETPILWAPDVKNWLTGKDPDTGKNWRWEEKGIRGWDGWMASPTQWTWVWARSGSWWWTGKPGVLQSMGLQRVRHDWVTELIYTKSYTKYFRCIFFFISSLYQMHKVNFHRRYCWTSYQVSISLPYFLIELQLLKVSTFLLCNLHLRKTVLSLSLGMELIDIRIIPLQQVVTSSAMWGLLNPGQWDMKESRLGVCEMILWS